MYPQGMLLNNYLVRAALDKRRRRHRLGGPREDAQPMTRRADSQQTANSSGDGTRQGAAVGYGPSPRQPRQQSMQTPRIEEPSFLPSPTVPHRRHRQSACLFSPVSARTNHVGRGARRQQGLAASSVPPSLAKRLIRGSQKREKGSQRHWRNRDCPRKVRPHVRQL